MRGCAGTGAAFFALTATKEPVRTMPSGPVGAKRMMPVISIAKPNLACRCPIRTPVMKNTRSPARPGSAARASSARETVRSASRRAWAIWPGSFASGLPLDAGMVACGGETAMPKGADSSWGMIVGAEPGTCGLKVTGSCPIAGISAGATMAIAVVHDATRPLDVGVIALIPVGELQSGNRAWVIDRTITSTFAMNFKIGAKSLGNCAISWVSGATSPGAIGCSRDGSWATALTKDFTASVAGVAVGSNVAAACWSEVAVVVADVVEDLTV